MSLWVEATHDHEAERQDELTMAATVATAGHQTFVLGAVSVEEFEDRIAVVASQVESAIERVTYGDPGMFPVVHQALLADWERSFDMLTEQRQAATQRANNRRGYERQVARGKQAQVVTAAVDGEIYSKTVGGVDFIWEYDSDDNTVSIGYAGGTADMDTASAAEYGSDGDPEEAAEALMRLWISDGMHNESIDSGRYLARRASLTKQANSEDEFDDLADWPTADKTIDALRSIVSDFSAKMVDGVMVDVQSANAIVTVYDALSDENKAKFIAMPIDRMGTAAWKLLSKHSSKTAAREGECECDCHWPIALGGSARPQDSGCAQCTDKHSSKTSAYGYSDPVSDTCPYCGKEGCSPDCPGPNGGATVCPQCGSAASVHDGQVQCSDPDGCGYGWSGPRHEYASRRTTSAWHSVNTETGDVGKQSYDTKALADDQNFGDGYTTEYVPDAKTGSWHREGNLRVARYDAAIVEVAEVEGQIHWGAYLGDTVLGEGQADTLGEGRRFAIAAAKTAGENPFAKKDDDDKPAAKADPKPVDGSDKPPAPAPTTGQDPAPVDPPGNTAPAEPGANPAAPAEQPPVADAAPAAAPNDAAQVAPQTGEEAKALDPTTMDVGMASQMSFTMGDGGAGQIEVSFIREENGVYYFNGPTGEFGVGQQNGQWQDSDGNTFTFGAVNSGADQGLTAAPGQDGAQPPADPNAAPTDPAAPAADAAPAKDAAPADDKAPADDAKDDDEKKKDNPFAKKSGTRHTASDWDEVDDGTNTIGRASFGGHTFELRYDGGGPVSEPEVDFQHWHNYTILCDGKEVRHPSSTASDAYTDAAASFSYYLQDVQRGMDPFAEPARRRRVVDPDWQD